VQPSSSPSNIANSIGYVSSSTAICIGGGCEAGLTCVAGAICAVTDDFKFICAEDMENSLEGSATTCVSTGDSCQENVPCCNPSAVCGADGTCSLNSLGCQANAPSAAPTQFYTLKPSKTYKPTRNPSGNEFKTLI